MIQRLRPLTIVVLGLCGAWPYAHAQLRSDLIESARTEKEANLKPETTPEVERRLVWAQNSLAYRFLTGDVGGIGIAAGSFIPGSGFAVGPTFSRNDLWQGKLTLSAEARATLNESYLGRFGVSLPRLAGGRAALDFSVAYRNISEMPYYGPGPESEKTGRSNFRIEDTNLEVRPSFQLYKGLRAGAIGSYQAINTAAGHSSRYILADRQYGPGSAAGIDRQTNFWRGGGFLEFDWRDRPQNPSSGGRYRAQYVRYLDRTLGAYSFLRLDLDASQYIPFFNRTRVIALHGSSSLTTAGSSQRVPFYLQPVLGGPTTLRGYRFNRFYGDNSVMVNAEYRWELSPILDMVAFADGGKVFHRWEQWNLHGLESSVGFGVRLKMRSKVVFSIDSGFSHEGFQLWFRSNSLF